jgi:hypothetical protein
MLYLCVNLEYSAVSINSKNNTINLYSPRSYDNYFSPQNEIARDSFLYDYFLCLLLPDSLSAD